MKIFFNRVPRSEPWGGGNQFLVKMVAKLQQRGHEVVYHLVPGLDVIFLMDPRPGDIGYSIEHIAAYKQAFPHTKILHRVNECDKRKGTEFMDPLLVQSAAIADEVVFISRWLQEYFVERGVTKPSRVIYNGCDTTVFGPSSRSALNDPVKVVTHHWSDNWMKGFDIYTQIDRYLQENEANFEFTYVGRYCKEYQPKATTCVKPLHGQALAEQLRQHDIYITASRWEPCGMHHIEGAAAGMPVLYHRDSGGIVEFCQNHGEAFSTFEEFLEKLQVVIDNYASYREKIDYNALSLDRVTEEYAQVVESMRN